MNRIFASLIPILFAGLFFWLLPVAPQSFISTETILSIWAGGTADGVRMELVNPVWRGAVGLLWRLQDSLLPVAAREVYPTVAALHAWFVVFSIGLILWRLAPARFVRAKTLTLLFVALMTPAFLWSAVVPTGASVVVFALTLSWFLETSSAIDGGRDHPSNWRRNLARAADGAALALSPVGWVAVLVRFFDRSWIYTAATFCLVMLASGGRIPAVATAMGLGQEDRLGAGVVIAGGGGEIRLALLSGISWVLLLFVLDELLRWNRSLSVPRTDPGQRLVPMPIRTAAAGALTLFFFLLQFGLFASRGHAWKLAHPGWNTILADSVRNAAAGSLESVDAYFPTATEWALANYRERVLNPASEVGIPNSIGKITAHLGTVDDATVSRLIHGGKSLWLVALPNLDRGARIRFLGYGVLVSGLPSESDATQFGFGLEGLRGVAVRSSLSLSEVVEPKPLELSVYERYAVFHRALARTLKKQKQPVDWERRAYLEEFAALRKVPWLSEPFQSVCIEHPAGEEPEDYCTVVRPYHERKAVL